MGKPSKRLRLSTFLVSVGGLPKVTLGAMSLWSVTLPLRRGGFRHLIYLLIKPLAQSYVVIQFLAHSRTQCLLSGTAVSGLNPSSAASKLSKLDYPFRGMPSGSEVFYSNWGWPSNSEFSYLNIRGCPLR